MHRYVHTKKTIERYLKYHSPGIRDSSVKYSEKNPAVPYSVPTLVSEYNKELEVKGGSRVVVVVVEFSLGIRGALKSREW